MLDRTDLRMALIALNYYIRALQLVHRPVPPAAHRLADHLTTAMAVNGQESQRVTTDWITTDEAAKRIGCSQRHARRLAARIGTRTGRQWLIPADALED